jgi:Asp-tRNA(Asn)/Glu-tRNA(Gln) amidotransferase A subunit family amidase
MAAKNELPSLSSVEMRRRIGSKEISPVELLEACIARIEAVNPAVNAVTATAFAQGRKAAKAAEAAVLKGEPLGALHGLPTGIKDLEETAGLLTTHGSPLFRDHVPKHDNVMVERVRKAGAVIVAKTNVPEFGAGANSRNVVWGATGNPFDPRLNAGGSSGGSAVALATDMLPVCTGSDTGGSLRIPAAINGVVGMRPSPGLVPNGKAQRGWANISVIGPMGRSVADTCQLLAAQAGLHPVDPLSYPSDPAALGRPAACDLGRLRVAWTEDFGQCPVEQPIRKVLRERIGAMRHLFKACDEVKLDFGEADRCFDVLRAVSFIQRYQAEYERDKALLGPNIRANYEIGMKMTLADVAWAEAEQTRIYRRFQATFRDYDVVLGPTVPVTPFPWTQLYLAEMEGKALRNYYHWLAPTYVITIVNNPAISIPAGVDHKGMPFGLQVIGQLRRDGELLAAAHAMEEAFARIPALERPRPDLAKLGKPTPELKSIVTHPPKRSEMG